MIVNFHRFDVKTLFNRLEDNCQEDSYQRRIYTCNGAKLNSPVVKTQPVGDELLNVELLFTDDDDYQPFILDSKNNTITFNSRGVYAVDKGKSSTSGLRVRRLIEIDEIEVNADGSVESGSISEKVDTSICVAKPKKRVMNTPVMHCYYIDNTIWEGYAPAWAGFSPSASGTYRYKSVANDDYQMTFTPKSSATDKNGSVTLTSSSKTKAYAAIGLTTNGEEFDQEIIEYGKVSARIIKVNATHLFLREGDSETMFSNAGNSIYREVLD